MKRLDTETKVTKRYAYVGFEEDGHRELKIKVQENGESIPRCTRKYMNGACYFFPLHTYWWNKKKFKCISNEGSIRWSQWAQIWDLPLLCSSYPGTINFLGLSINQRKVDLTCIPPFCAKLTKNRNDTTEACRPGLPQGSTISIICPVLSLLTVSE